jgi:hypothetical protein
MTLKRKIYENWSLEYQIKALNKSFNFVLITSFYVTTWFRSVFAIACLQKITHFFIFTGL